MTLPWCRYCTKPPISLWPSSTLSPLASMLSSSLAPRHHLFYITPYRGHFHINAASWTFVVLHFDLFHFKTMVIFTWSEWISEWVIDWLIDWLIDWVGEWVSQWVNESVSQWVNGASENRPSERRDEGMTQQGRTPEKNVNFIVVFLDSIVYCPYFMGTPIQNNILTPNRYIKT